MTRTAEARDEALTVLDVLFVEEGDAHRAYLRPTRGLPRYLKPFFDLHGESFPVLLDLEDLDRQMKDAGATYEKRVSRAGSVELTAHGESASALALWLSTAVASGVRPRER
jgi:hypothetical protein